jgi:hypothetical protein
MGHFIAVRIPVRRLQLRRGLMFWKSTSELLRSALRMCEYVIDEVLPKIGP